MANAKAGSNNKKAKASDKAIVPLEEKKGMTNAELIAALDAVGVKPAAKAVKADLEKLFEDNKEAIELIGRLKENKKACIVKAFGAHGASKLCVKCKKQTKAVYTDCAAYMKLAGIKKAAAKKTRMMGHKTGTDLWETKKGKYNNKFCHALLESGEAGLTHSEARKAKWNPKGYSFKETANRLANEDKYITVKDGRMYVTAKGLKKAEGLIAA
jgi:hypothetical protein